MKRLQAFLFVLLRRDGRREDVIFYALDARTATRYARAWCQRMGHRRVELVEDEEQAA